MTASSARPASMPAAKLGESAQRNEDRLSHANSLWSKTRCHCKNVPNRVWEILKALASIGISRAITRRDQVNSITQSTGCVSGPILSVLRSRSPAYLRETLRLHSPRRIPRRSSKSPSERRLRPPGRQWRRGGQQTHPKRTPTSVPRKPVLRPRSRPNPIAVGTEALEKEEKELDRLRDLFELARQTFGNDHVLVTPTIYSGHRCADGGANIFTCSNRQVRGGIGGLVIVPLFGAGGGHGARLVAGDRNRCRGRRLSTIREGVS